MFEKALNAGFIQATDYVEIWQAYLDYLRRRVDFTQGIYGICVNKQLNCFLCTSLKQWHYFLKKLTVVSYLSQKLLSGQLVSIKYMNLV